MGFLSDAAAWLTNSLGLTKKMDSPGGTYGELRASQIKPPNVKLAPAPNVSSIATSFKGQAEIEALNRQTAAIQAQIAAMPKLIYRDTNAAWQQAQNTAASSVNPVYQDNLNRKLNELATLRRQQTENVTAAKTAEDTTLQQTQEDIGVNRQRTAEDTASAIANNLQAEGTWQTQEGQQADAQEEAARLALGDQGIMGRGAGQLETAKIQRNQTSDQQTREFQQDRETKQLLQTRTFQDLDTKGTRAVKFNETQKADLDRSLRDFIENQAIEEQNFRASNEAARLSALFDATQNQYKTDTANWLSSLWKSGARQQDIALATQVYGGR